MIRNHWRAAALYLLAAAWPWEVYGLLPGLYVPLSLLAALALAAGLAVDVIRSGRPKIPFDLLWPAVLLALSGLALGGLQDSLDLFAGGLALMAVVHTAQHRELVLRALRLTVLSTAAVALISLAGKTGTPVPTAFSPVSGAVLSFPRDLPGGALTLVLGGGLAFALAFTPMSRVQRTGLLFVGFFPLSLVVMMSIRTLMSPAAWTLPELPPPSATLLVGAISLWLCARVCGRLIVSRLEDAPGIQIALLVVTLGGGLTALACLKLPGHGVLATLGLIAAYAVPRWKAPAYQDAWRWPFWLAFLTAAALGAFNIGLVFENNPRDPRNYAQTAREWLADARYEALDVYLAFWDRAVPGERRTHWWRAQMRLRQGDLEGAATAFRHALQPGLPRLLPPPATDEIEVFLGRLRDAVSAQPLEARGLAYERALLGAGRRDQALASLRVRGDGGADLPPMPALARALAAMLGAPETAAELAEWPGGELVRIFASLGADIEHAPLGFPPHRLPLVLHARADAASVCVEVWAGSAHFGGEWLVQDSVREDRAAGALYWGPFRRAGGGEWVATLGPEMLAELHFGGDPRIDFNTEAAYPSPGKALRVRIP